MTQRRTKRKSRRNNKSNKNNQVQTRRNSRKQNRKQSGGKRKMNAFFKQMMQAKKSNAASFKYKNKLYKRQQKGHLTFYKA